MACLYPTSGPCEKPASWRAFSCLRFGVPGAGHKKARFRGPGVTSIGCRQAYLACSKMT